MDDRQFDKITKAIGSGTSRRTLLKRGGALFVGTLAGAVGVRSGASAQTTCTCDRGIQTCRTVTTTERTETRTRSGRQACTIGKSGNQGTQAGTFTDTVVITTTTTTTQRFRGCGNQKKPIGQPQTTTTTTERVTNTTFTATGPCNAGQGG